MHEYSFISIPTKRHRSGTVPEVDYRDVIREQAAQGWEFVQAIPLMTDVKPRLELVFRREATP